jgi:hypothetical protein
LTLFLFNVFLFAQGIPPDGKICGLKKRYAKELYLLKKNVNLILKDKNYIEVMDSFCIGEKIANRKDYSFRLNLLAFLKHIDSVIKKETNYINTYCSAYYTDAFKNTDAQSDTLFKYLNDTFSVSLKRKNYYFEKVSYVPCFLARESRVLVHSSGFLNKDLSDLNFFCGFLKKKYKNIKINSFLNLLKTP